MNKKGVWGLVVVVLVVMGGVLLFGFWGGQDDGKSEKIKIAATIFPLCDLTEQVVGSEAEIICLLPPGASPHTFELSPQTVAKLTDVDLVFYMGYGIDDWVLDYAESSERTKVVRVDRGIDLRSFAVEDEESIHVESDHEGGEIDPHYWLTASNAEKISRTIYETILKTDTENKDIYQKNWVAVEQGLAKLDGEIRLNLTNLRNRKMVTMHQAWGYFAAAYDLEVVATFEPFPGKEPTPKYLAEVSETMERERVVTIFSEPQMSNEVLKPFVKDLDLQLYILDPLGGVPERESYVEMMEYNAATIKEALGK